ncbi:MULTISPECIES: hypothetical protein [Kamptonema]|uniref:hypothetical protein n=1 Tax=Kamptonema TaxID=1501433 RepID=UPI0001DAD346|nr:MULTISPECIES: hypothetical protein [Kamptonema]CBN55858.1 conserved hypothetical protein [Kamptonema sp. PCC 6506]
MKDFNLIKRSPEIVKLALINLVLLFTFLEAGSLGLYFVKNHQFFYTREKPKDTPDLGIDLEGVRLGESIVERIHPFFGFVQKPGGDFRPGFKINNYGFISPYDYPFKKKNKNQFIVGIFGGSVASNFSIYEVQNKIVAKYLKRLPELKDKEVIVLSFATGGYKQPQQLLILNYFLMLGQELDLVINIDGFNEVALASLNNREKIDISMPSVQHLQPLTNLANNSLSTKALTAILKIQENKDRIKDAVETLKNCKLALCNSINSFYIQSFVNEYRRNLIRFERERKKQAKQSSGSIIYVNSEDAVLKDPVAFEKMANTWAKSSIFMNKVLSSSNVLYFHFFQPNQYFPTPRVFSEAEKKVAFNKDTPYAKSVKAGYPILFTKFRNLQKNNVRIFDAVNIFDKTKESVYIDSCCHYNKKGEEIFANYVGNSILKQLISEKGKK